MKLLNLILDFVIFAFKQDCISRIYQVNRMKFKKDGKRERDHLSFKRKDKITELNVQKLYAFKKTII